MPEGAHALPTLDFLSEFNSQDNESRFSVGVRLNAVMLYPTNWQLREEYIVFREVEWEQHKARTREGNPIAGITGNGKIDDWLSRLADMQRRHIEPEIRKRTHTGILAGKRLYYVAGLAIHINGGSFRRADELISYKRDHDIGGKIIATAKGAIHPAWREYKSVSHLWTAEWITKSVYPDLQNMPEHYPEKLIPIAEWFRKFGESYYPGNTKQPVLEPDWTWQPPPDFQMDPFNGEDFLIQDIGHDFWPENLAKLP